MQPDSLSGVPLLRLLFVDNALTDYALLVRYIERGGYTIQSERVENAAQLRQSLDGTQWDAVISELDLPGFLLSDVLKVLRETAIELPLIVVTSGVDEEAAAAVLAAGADDYVSKSALKRLVPALKRSLAAAAARDLHGILGELVSGMRLDLTWLTGNGADDAALARMQQMLRALESASERAAQRMLRLQPSPRAL